MGTGIRWCRAKIAAAREELAAQEAELAKLLEAAGRRPGNESDQPALFAVAETTPSMF